MVVGLSACATPQKPLSFDTQSQTGLSSRDSAQLRVASLRAVLDSITSPWTKDTRLWIRPPWRRVPDTNKRERAGFTAFEWSPIEEEFPTAVQAPREESLFLCPPAVPGGRPVMDVRSERMA